MELGSQERARSPLGGQTRARGCRAGRRAGGALGAAPWAATRGARGGSREAARPTRAAQAHNQNDFSKHPWANLPVTLTLTADRPQAQIAVRLCHVHPDGASTRITWGVLNLSHRDSHADPAPLVPGQPVTVTLDLDHIAYRVPAGHRLRLAVSSSYWPMLWPAPESAALMLSEGHLDLPVHPAPDGPGWDFPAPDAPTSATHSPGATCKCASCMTGMTVPP